MQQTNGKEQAARPLVAFLTIGQAPRDDVTPELLARIDRPIDAVEFGVLDEADAAALRRLAPAPDRLCLYTRLRSGRSVVVDGEASEAGMARLCAELDQKGFDLLVISTTGLFRPVRTRTPLIHGQRVVDAWIDALVTAHSRIGVVYPLERQLNEERFVHGTAIKSLATSALSGRGDSAEEAAGRLKDCDLIVMHSVGYTEAVARQVAALTGKPVVTARRILAGAIRLQLGQLDSARLWSENALEMHLDRIEPPLTEREREVTVHAVGGLSNKQIGLALGISHRTVEIHRARAMKKLGVSTVSGLIRQLLILQ